MTPPSVDELHTFSWYAPTNEDHIGYMLKLANVTSKDYVLDLGAGDGSFLRAVVARTGCRGLGIEVDAELHRQAQDVCAREIAAGQLTFWHKKAEHIRIESLVGHTTTLVTLVYVFATGNLARCPLVMMLLKQFLAHDIRIVTNTFWLPTDMVGAPVRSYPDLDSDVGMAECLSRVAGDRATKAIFHLYGMTRSERKAKEKKDKRIAEQQSAMDRAFAEVCRHHASHAQARRDLQRMIAAAQILDEETSRDAEERQRYLEEKREELELEAASLRELEERARAAEEREAQRLAVEMKASALPASGCRAATASRELPEPASPEWECVDCRWSNSGGEQECSFCGSQRGTGLLAWARSDTPWETRNGQEFLPPAELVEDLERDLVIAARGREALCSAKVTPSKVPAVSSRLVNRQTHGAGPSASDVIFVLAREALRSCSDARRLEHESELRSLREAREAKLLNLGCLKAQQEDRAAREGARQQADQQRRDERAGQIARARRSCADLEARLASSQRRLARCKAAYEGPPLPRPLQLQLPGNAVLAGGYG